MSRAWAFGAGMGWTMHIDKTNAAGDAKGYDHRAVFYDGEAGFVAAVLPFLAQGVDRGQAVLAVLTAPRIARLRERLGRRATSVEFLDVIDVGVNPARLIPLWRRFADDCLTSRGGRGVGEPVVTEHHGPALREAQHHEALMDLAFADHPPLSVRCPYDVTRLSPAVVDEARRVHGDDGVHRTMTTGAGLDARPEHALAPVPAGARGMRIRSARALADVRTMVARAAGDAGLASDRTDDVVVAANELVANTIRHGGGHGTVRVWCAEGELLCEVADRGYITDPLAGRRRPDVGQYGGRGLWLANQLCDLVEIRTRPGRTVVRLHVALVPDATSSA